MLIRINTIKTRERPLPKCQLLALSEFLLNNVSDQQDLAAAQQVGDHEGGQGRHEHHGDAADDTREAQRENNA